MKLYTTEEVRYKLSQPNGPALIDIGPAFHALEQLVLEEKSSQALSVFVRAARQKEYRSRISAMLDPEQMAVLLLSADPKVRKNAARLCGALGRPVDAEALWQAFEQETVRLVRPSQILALGALGRGERLKDWQVPPASGSSEEKHVREEEQALNTVLSAIAPKPKHSLKGLPRGILTELTTADHMEPVLVRELASVGLAGEKTGRGRVQLKLDSYKSLMQVRSFREILFPLLSFNAPQEQWAKVLKDRVYDRLIHQLETVYAGEAPFSYRIEIRAENVDRGQLSRQIAAAFGSEKLVNSPSEYENELRLEQRGKTTTVYLKLCTLKDPRFAYRKGTVPASIHPSTAAAIMQLAAPYFKPNASVLDPCCGSGTMLIERAMYDTTGQLMGIDISRRAARIAEDNAEAAGLEARFIVKDCTQFKARTRFDEIISNLPFGNRVGDHETNVHLYDELFRHLPLWLKKDGICIFYTMEKKLIRQMIEKHKDRLDLLLEQTTEAGGLDPGIYILKLRG